MYTVLLLVGTLAPAPAQPKGAKPARGAATPAGRGLTLSPPYRPAPLRACNRQDQDLAYSPLQQAVPRVPHVVQMPWLHTRLELLEPQALSLQQLSPSPPQEVHMPLLHLHSRTRGDECPP